VHDILKRVIAERENELASLDLGQIEHIVDQAEEMPAIAFNAFEHAAHLVRRIAVDLVEDQPV
jgi:hypothetical protein